MNHSFMGRGNLLFGEHLFSQIMGIVLTFKMVFYGVCFSEICLIRFEGINFIDFHSMHMTNIDSS
jgi:hypothetical protein